MLRFALRTSLPLVGRSSASSSSSAPSSFSSSSLFFFLRFRRLPCFATTSSSSPYSAYSPPLRRWEEQVKFAYASGEADDIEQEDVVTAIFEFNENRGDHELIFEAWKQLLETNVKLEPEHYHIYLTACIFLAKDDAAFEALHQMKKAGLISLLTLHTCQAACIRANRWPAYDEYEKRLVNEVTRDDLSIALKLIALEKQNMWDEFGKTVTELKKYTPQILNVIIPAVIRQGKADEAKKLYNESKVRGWKVTSQTFRRCLQACQELRNWTLFDEWEREMESVIGLKNAKATLSNRLTALVQQRNWDEARKMFDSMNYPNLHDYTMIIVASLRQHNFKLAHSYYLRLKDERLLPDSYVFSRCMDTCCSEEQWDEWDKWFERAKRRNLYDSFILSSQLYRHQRREEYDKIRTVYEEAKAKGVYPNSFGYGSVVMAAAKYSLGDTTAARKIYEESKENRVPVHSSFFNRLLAFFVRERNLEAFMEWYNVMVEDGIPPSVHTHALCMEAKERAGRPAREILEDWRRILEATPTPPTYAYTTLMIALAKEENMEKVEQLWKELLRSGNNVDCIFFNRMMLLAVTMKHWKSFEVWEKRMLEAKTPPNDATFAIRERGYKSRKMLDDWSKVREQRTKWYEEKGRYRRSAKEEADDEDEDRRGREEEEEARAREVVREAVREVVRENKR